jgi:hypothetical protein
VAGDRDAFLLEMILRHQLCLTLAGQGLLWAMLVVEVQRLDLMLLLRPTTGAALFHRCLSLLRFRHQTQRPVGVTLWVAVVAWVELILSAWILNNRICNVQAGDCGVGRAPEGGGGGTARVSRGGAGGGARSTTLSIYLRLANACL